MTDNRRSVRERAERGSSDRERWLAQRDQINEQVRENLPTLDAILPSHMNAAQFSAIVSGLLASNDDLAIAAIRNPTSFLAALADAARLGLIPGDGYALMPFGVDSPRPGVKPEVVGTAEYTGEIQLIYNTGLIESVHAEVVFEHDHYMPSRHSHEPPEWSRGPTEFALDVERGQPVGAFCYCIDLNGKPTRVVRMNRDEIMAHREFAKSKKLWDGPFWRSAWLKTVVHEEYKWVAKSAEVLREQARASAAVGSSPLAGLPVAGPADLDAPVLKVRAIGAAPANPAPAGTRSKPTAYSRVMDLFDTIGCTSADEQLAVVQAVCPDYQTGATISDEQARAVATQLQQFIDGADDPGDPGTDDEFTGNTPYDVLRTWLASPAGVHEPGDPE